MPEPKRSILVPGDPIEMIGLTIDGAGYTNLVRRMWQDGAYLRAISLLMEGLKGLNWHVAVAILEGRMKLTGTSPEIHVMKDDAGGLAYDQAALRQEKLIELARIGERVVNPINTSNIPAFSTPEIDSERELDDRMNKWTDEP